MSIKGLHVMFEMDHFPWKMGEWVESIEQAQAIADANNYKIRSIRRNPKPLVSDGSGFKTGFNPGLGIEIKSKRHYYEELKLRNLEEVGNERLKHKELNHNPSNYFSESCVKAMNEMGAGLSDNECKELINNGT